ncbi:T9SS type A sorting domain-containing protein [Flavobacterium wongokense]|uniref:T9SS type A sorting domain-containing protein n=1 Tax=Flavobacterium wongokense TaxID=2910674 RepID=UPI001F46A22C|nr:T9SS type A sorting domain-containing protein [Flavobacterium sp. WG47]MCF6132786.1 T9SS type A sorting domain-containing protein [Flavobacterium sp. WG47]
MRKIIVTIITLLSIQSVTRAQVASYTFQHEAHAFPYLAAIPSATINHHDITDDFVLPTEAGIPFNFRFGNTYYNTVNISENGFVWFGSATTSDITQWNPITNPQPANLTGIISAIGVDLHPQYTGSDFTRIRSGYFGDSPNQVFVIEWYHTSRISVINEAAGPDELDFQIRLHETSNKVEIIYGRFRMNPLYFESVQVGLKTTNSDFSLRSTANAQWNATVNGATLNSSCFLSNTFKPANGQFMVWTPQSLSVNDGQLNNVSLYPIPASASLHIHGLETASLTYRVIDLTGRIIAQGITDDYSIPVDNLQSGTFLLELKSDDNVAYHKFVKM